MSTITNVLTQDGQAAIGPATDDVGGDTSVEFLAALSLAAGTLPVPAPIEAPVPPVDAALGDAALADRAGHDDGVDGALAALAAAAVPMLVPAAGRGAPQAVAVQPGGPTELRKDVPAALPNPLVSPDPGAQVGPAEQRNVPAVTLPANASPVAVAVLHALQPGPRPVPVAAVAPPAVQSATDAMPVTEAVTRLADVVAQFATSEEGAQAGSDGDGTPAGTSGQPVPSGPLARDSSVGAVHHRTLPGTVGTAPWRQALGTELHLMIERGVGAATLRLSPEHLGPVEVRIDFGDDGANVWFSAAHPDTRAALADALPRLRDMLASVGVNLGEAGVQRDVPGDSARRDGAWTGSGPTAQAPDEPRVVVARLGGGRGMVDEYA